MSGAAEMDGIDTADRASLAHARQMDTMYRVQRHFYDLTRKYYLLGRDRLIRELAVPDGGHVLEIGCGTARNLELIGNRYPAASLHGLDISAEMLVSARKRMDRTGRRYALGLGDATAFDPDRVFGRGEFDSIVMSYTLSMIPDWTRALDHAAGMLAPGGSLHVVDFGQQKRLPQWTGALLRAWLARFHVTPRADLFTAAQDCCQRRGLSLVMASPCRDYARMVTLRRAG
ncbi:class I SAM-dependent methyltransferase [Croceicoccus bisphenolivorans]|uniref:class I SAM-dependent methyltransferase n=1 Tax=Croceicoccus bisphenolivorans TaxID=1783232 RepID=UPI001FE1461C|nr:class I SAM-dependent methyltransferase [Croceicoccus bisphenolivorans]